MSELPTPIRRGLRDTTSEAAIMRMWQGIRSRRERTVPVGWLVMRAGGVGAAAAVVLMLVLQLATRPESTVDASAQPSPPAKFTQSDGRAISPVDVAREAKPKSIGLSDGSQIVFEPDTLWEPLAASDTQFVSSLRQGTAVFEVVPGGPRRWIVDVGPVRIEVVGTRFTVTRNDNRLRVSVERGAVLVRGKPVPDGVQRLGAGDSITVVLPSAALTPAPATSDTKLPVPAKPPTAGQSEWLSRAERGDYRAAYATLGTDGVRRETQRAQSAARLLALADVARLSGHPAQAVEPLDRVIRTHAGSAEAKLAAVTLGRLYLDQLGQPAAAANILQRALALGPPAGLREDVYARLVEAQARSGDISGARESFKTYRREFPEGRRAPDLARWVSP